MGEARNLFEGEKVRLRAYEPGDVETMFRHLLDSEISRRDNVIWWPYSRSEIAQNVEKMNTPGTDDSRQLAIETLDGKLIGGLAVGQTDRKSGVFAIGLGLAERAEWGKGYAKEAMLLAMRFMFHELRYQKCNLGVYAFNPRAVGLYQRLGFVEEGRRRRNLFSNGAFHDEILMGITMEEFDALHPAWRLPSLDEG